MGVALMNSSAHAGTPESVKFSDFNGCGKRTKTNQPTHKNHDTTATTRSDDDNRPRTHPLDDLDGVLLVLALHVAAARQNMCA